MQWTFHMFSSQIRSHMFHIPCYTCSRANSSVPPVTRLDSRRYECQTSAYFLNWSDCRLESVCLELACWPVFMELYLISLCLIFPAPVHSGWSRSGYSSSSRCQLVRTNTKLSSDCFSEADCMERCGLMTSPQCQAEEREIMNCV